MIPKDNVGPSQEAGKRSKDRPKFSLTVAGISLYALLEKWRRHPQSLPPSVRSKLVTEQHSTADKKSQVVFANTYDASTYPNAYEDLDPVSPCFFPKALKIQEKTSFCFGVEMCQAFAVVKNKREKLSRNPIFTFCSHSIEMLVKELPYRSCAFLPSREIHDKEGHETTHAESFKWLSYRILHIQVASSSTMERKAHQLVSTQKTKLVQNKYTSKEISQIKYHMLQKRHWQARIIANAFKTRRYTMNLQRTKLYNIQETISGRVKNTIGWWWWSKKCWIITKDLPTKKPRCPGLHEVVQRKNVFQAPEKRTWTQL